MENWWIGWVFVGVSMAQCYQILRAPEDPWVRAVPVIFSLEFMGFAMMVSVPWVRILAIGSAAIWFAWAWATSHFYLFISEKGE